MGTGIKKILSAYTKVNNLGTCESLVYAGMWNRPSNIYIWKSP